MAWSSYHMRNVKIETTVKGMLGEIALTAFLAKSFNGAVCQNLVVKRPFGLPVEPEAFDRAVETLWRDLIFKLREVRASIGDEFWSGGLARSREVFREQLSNLTGGNPASLDLIPDGEFYELIF